MGDNSYRNNAEPPQEYSPGDIDPVSNHAVPTKGGWRITRRMCLFMCALLLIEFLGLFLLRHFYLSGHVSLESGEMMFFLVSMLAIATFPFSIGSLMFTLGLQVLKKDLLFRKMLIKEVWPSALIIRLIWKECWEAEFGKGEER